MCITCFSGDLPSMDCKEAQDLSNVTRASLALKLIVGRDLDKKMEKS